MAGRKHWKVRRRAPRARIHVNSLTNLVKFLWKLTKRRIDEDGYLSEYDERGRGIPGHEDQCPLINSSSAPLDTFWQSPGGFFSMGGSKGGGSTYLESPPMDPGKALH